jgi:hypothetical protein
MQNEYCFELLYQVLSRLEYDIAFHLELSPFNLTQPGDIGFTGRRGEYLLFFLQKKSIEKLIFFK